VIGPDPQGGCLSYTHKSELEQACLDEAGRCFMQVHDTPLLLPPLVNIFGETGSTFQSFKQVLTAHLHLQWHVTCLLPNSYIICTALPKFTTFHYARLRNTNVDGAMLMRQPPHLPLASILGIILLALSTQRF